MTARMKIQVLLIKLHNHNYTLSPCKSSRKRTEEGMNRPSHLPEFESPPVDEVVMGVQFGSVMNFNTLMYSEVFELFREQYPQAVEQPLLAPTFETFGGKSRGQGIQINFGPERARYWFISQDQSHLIQFQPDRLLINWRKRSTGDEYPRFENILETFEHHFNTLNNWYTNKFKSPLQINQTEISYINLITVEEYSELSEWINLFTPSKLNIEGIKATFNEVLKDNDSKGFARIYHELHAAVSPDASKKAFRLTLTVKGSPKSPQLESSCEFLKMGREKIVLRFDEITTEQAHTVWKKVK